ncbi:YusW family protein [Paenibacillus sp. MAH-36]|uniref:YusW family protein n=1 Tax=Paenibacillus violae TaxID=3077234 RepID=A0ABU3RPP0_9BACL|nr:YusW family protein [Paenibacillus sp. PFR10]MDU0206245.1 YusW family protein [Paenibacillus sp. PFR10]
MRKRLPFIVISITLVALLVCGWTAYASTSPNSAISTSVNGTFKSASSEAVTVTTATGDQTVPLAKSVWVFKNDQKAQLADLHTGDQIELILNSKQQAAYVKASSSVTNEPTPSPAASAAPVVPTQSPAATVVPTQTPTPTSAAPTPESSTKPATADKVNYPDLQGFDLNVDGKHFKLHIGQSKDDKGTTYDLSVKPEDSGMIHLKGEEAAQWIQNLLASIDLKSSDAEQKIAGLLAQHYNLDANKLNVHMKTKWQQPQQPQQVQKKPGDDHDDKRKDEPNGGPKAKDDHKDERKNKDKPRGNSQHDE